MLRFFIDVIVILLFNGEIKSALKGLVTLNHPTFNHATVNHQPVINCAFSNMPIETDVHGEYYDSAMFSIKTWKERGHYRTGTASFEKKTTNAVKGRHFGLQVGYFSVSPSNIIGLLSCKGSKKIFKCNVRHFCKELLVHV